MMNSSLLQRLPYQRRRQGCYLLLCQKCEPHCSRSLRTTPGSKLSLRKFHSTLSFKGKPRHDTTKWIGVAINQATSKVLLSTQPQMRRQEHRKVFSILSQIFTIVNSNGKRALSSLASNLIPVSSDDSKDTSILTTEKKSEEELIEIGRSIFTSKFNYELDDWQLLAGGAIVEGYHVVLSSPTGSGKTAVGTMALFHAFEHRKMNGVYTTPLKALTNQKYHELLKAFGQSVVGLSTGDLSVNNRDASITVETTEVYRSRSWDMIGTNLSDTTTGTRTSTTSTPIIRNQFHSRSLVDNGVVVLDEFHYMADADRGGVWEECILTCPPWTQIVALSATLSNGINIAQWIESVTQRQCMYIEVGEEKRSVPLRYMYATKDYVVPLFNDPNAGPGAPNGLLGYDRQQRELPITATPDKNASARDREQAKFEFDNKTNNETMAKRDMLPYGLKVNTKLQYACNNRMKKGKSMLDSELNRRHNDSHSNTSRFDSRTRTTVIQNNNNFDTIDNKDSLNSSGPSIMNTVSQRRLNAILSQHRSRLVPESLKLILQFRSKQLLPAIYFCFSRVKCNEKADYVSCQLLERQIKINNVIHKSNINRQNSNDNLGTSRRIRSLHTLQQQSPLENLEFYYSAGLLDTMEDVVNVAERISKFNDRYTAAPINDKTISNLLLGVGTHHAGMLPIHKTIVEQLFQNQLMKIVYATETLAAGINMPARSTIISALRKPTQSSHLQLLDTHNLIQMAGRAGRRGMDISGTCVIVASLDDDEPVAVDVLTDPIKPIPSSFSPPYALVVILIDRSHRITTASTSTSNASSCNTSGSFAKQILARTFDVWQRQQERRRRVLNCQLSLENNEDKDDAFNEYRMDSSDSLENDIDESQALNDLVAITNTLRAYNCIIELDQANTFSSHGIQKNDDKTTKQLVLDSESTLKISNVGYHVGQLRIENSLWGVVALGGTWACTDVISDYVLNTTNDAFSLIDLILNNDNISLPHMESTDLEKCLLTLSPSEMAGYVACIIAIRRTSSSQLTFNKGTGTSTNGAGCTKLTENQQTAIQHAFNAKDRLLYIQNKYGVNSKHDKIDIDVSLCKLATSWANGCSWEEALQMSHGLVPGDLSRALRRTMIVLRQIRNITDYNDSYSNQSPKRNDSSSTGSNNSKCDYNSDMTLGSSANKVPKGIHPHIRYLCGEALNLVGRFPILDDTSESSK